MLSGSVDEARHDRLRGWVRNPAFPDAPVSLLITAGRQLLERVTANRYRADVERAGFGHGRFGFDVRFDPPLGASRAWTVHIRSEADGEDIPGSPVRLACSAEWNGAAFAAALGAAGTPAELEERIAFLAAGRDTLLRMRQERWDTPQPRALVIDATVPVPARDAGSVALLSHMRSLSRLGFGVSFATPDGAAGDRSALAEAGVAVCGTPWYGSVEEVLRREAGRFDLVYLHRVATATAYAGLVRACQPRARLVYSVADLHHLRLARQAEYEQRPALMQEARSVRAAELWAARSADAVITHSAAEAELLRQAVPPERVHVVPWSVPCRPTAVPFAQRAGLAFIGHYPHAPNLAAALLLCERIMPLVNAADPAVLCRLVGSDLPPALRTPPPGVLAVGPVPSLADVFDQVRLTVAPLPFGAGIKGKVLDSLAAGVPCVCSPVAAEGLDLPAELVAGDPASFADAVLRLHRDGDCNAAAAAAGVASVTARFCEAALDHALGAAVADALPLTV